MHELSSVELLAARFNMSFIPSNLRQPHCKIAAVIKICLNNTLEPNESNSFFRCMLPKVSEAVKLRYQCHPERKYKLGKSVYFIMAHLFIERLNGTDNLV